MKLSAGWREIRLFLSLKYTLKVKGLPKCVDSAGIKKNTEVHNGCDANDVHMDVAKLFKRPIFFHPGI